MVVPWFRRLVAGISPRWPEFSPNSVHVATAVDDVTLRKIFEYFPLKILIPPNAAFLSSIIRGRYNGPFKA
jgi:hypothetical protein